jgi:hypothetical protein
LLEALCYKPESRGLIPYEAIGFSNLPNSSSRTVALGSTFLIFKKINAKQGFGINRLFNCTYLETKITFPEYTKNEAQNLQHTRNLQCEEWVFVYLKNLLCLA